MIQKYAKSILSHIAIWGIYITLWSARDLVYYPNLLANIRTITTQLLPIIPLVYLNLYLLIPKLLFKKRYIPYAITLTALIGIMAVIMYHIDQVVYHHAGTAEFFRSKEGIFVILTEMFMLNVIATALFLVQQLYTKDLRMKELEKEKLKSELQLLKQQIHPHYLFNTLNTILMLMENNSEKAKAALIQFSDVLDHQLYETQKERISLKKELHYLQSYIRIEKVRNEDTLKMKDTIPAVEKDFLITPMLLIPFVENAIKHGMSSDGYWIDLKIEILEDKLIMNVKNSFPEKRSIKDNSSKGIGIENVRRRLGLIHPNSHELKIETQDNVYSVYLVIPLNPIE